MYACECVIFLSVLIPPKFPKWVHCSGTGIQRYPNCQFKSEGLNFFRSFGCRSLLWTTGCHSRDWRLDFQLWFLLPTSCLQYLMPTSCGRIPICADIRTCQNVEDDVSDRNVAIYRSWYSPATPCWTLAESTGRPPIRRRASKQLWWPATAGGGAGNWFFFFI